MRTKNVLSFPVKPEQRKTILTKIMDYFPTENGRNFIQWTATAVAAGCVCVTYLPQSIFFDEYRETFLDPLLTDITPKEVSEELKQSISEEALKLDLTKNKIKMIKSFTVAGFDIRDFGTLSSIYGGWIGIPANYFYKTFDDIDKSKMLIKNEPIEWDQLQDSLILTESEQKFAFCRTLLELKAHKMYVNTGIAVSSVVVTYTLGQYVNEKWKMFKRPYYIRYSLYPIIGLIGYGIFGLVTDFYTFRREKSIDKALAKLGPETAEAGISFYAKNINKNVAIREMSGENTYAADGNERRWLGFQTTPITKRKEFLEMKFKEMQRQQELIANADA